MEYGDIPLHFWSLRKQLMLEHCPREALLYYRESRLTGDLADSTPQTRYLHHLRRFLSTGEYRRKVLRENMRKLFYRVLNEDEEDTVPPLVDDALFSACSRQWETDWHHMLTGSWENDHRRVCLLELTRSGSSFAGLHQEMTAALRRSCDALEQGAWGRLQNIPFHLRRSIASPLLIHLNELACCCAPVCALERNGEFWIVESSRPDDRVALLHKFYAGTQRGYAPEKVRSFVLDDQNGDFYEFGAAMDISAAIRQISAGTQMWKELLAAPVEALPVTAANCDGCRFVSFCRHKIFPHTDTLNPKKG